MKKFLFAALATLTVAVVAACGPNWGYICVGDNCPDATGVVDPDAGCPIEDPTDLPPTDGGPTDPPTDGGPTDPPTDGGPTDPPGDGGPTDPPGDGGPTDPPGDGGPTDPPGDGGPTDPPGDGGDGKTCICHIPKGKPANAHTICIAEPALSAHLKHGDFVGPCNW